MIKVMGETLAAVADMAASEAARSAQQVQGEQTAIAINDTEMLAAHQAAISENANRAGMGSVAGEEVMAHGKLMRVDEALVNCPPFAKSVVAQAAALEKNLGDSVPKEIKKNIIMDTIKGIAVKATTALEKPKKKDDLAEQNKTTKTEETTKKTSGITEKKSDKLPDKTSQAEPPIIADRRRTEAKPLADVIDIHAARSSKRALKLALLAELQKQREADELAKKQLAKPLEIVKPERKHAIEATVLPFHKTSEVKSKSASIHESSKVERTPAKAASAPSENFTKMIGLAEPPTNKLAIEEDTLIKVGESILETVSAVEADTATTAAEASEISKLSDFQDINQSAQDLHAENDEPETPNLSEVVAQLFLPATEAEQPSYEITSSEYITEQTVGKQIVVAIEQLDPEQAIEAEQIMNTINSKAGIIADTLLIQPFADTETLAVFDEAGEINLTALPAEQLTELKVACADLLDELAIEYTDATLEQMSRTVLRAKLTNLQLDQVEVTAQETPSCPADRTDYMREGMGNGQDDLIKDEQPANRGVIIGQMAVFFSAYPRQTAKLLLAA